MFLLIYKCRIAVSVRGKWFWKAWHCKLSLSDRLSAPADQKMPQSMMSDRQANSPGGQTLLPHSKCECLELCACGKVAEVGVSPLGPSVSDWSHVDGKEILFEFREKIKMFLPLTFSKNECTAGFWWVKDENAPFVQSKVKGQLESFKQKFMRKWMQGGGDEWSSLFDRSKCGL